MEFLVYINFYCNLLGYCNNNHYIKVASVCCIYECLERILDNVLFVQLIICLSSCYKLFKQCNDKTINCWLTNLSMKKNTVKIRIYSTFSSIVELFCSRRSDNGCHQLFSNSYVTTDGVENEEDWSSLPIFFAGSGKLR